MTKEQEKNKIWSAVLEKPDRDRYHWLYVILYMLGITAALWQHGNSGLTIFLLGAVPFLSLFAYIQYSLIPPLIRYCLKALIGLICLGWLFIQLRKGIMFDKAIIETVAILGLTFSMGDHRKDYRFLLILSLLMILYGSLMPRLVLLWLFAAAATGLLLLLYFSRIQSLTGGSANGKLSGSLRRTWFLYLIHLLLAAGIFRLIFSALPIRESTANGVFEVSFMTEKDSMLPPDMATWMHSPKKPVQKSPQGALHAKTGQPDTLDIGGTPMNIKGSKQKTAQEGSGSAPPSDEILFRAKSPAKLYHCVMFYDLYNGRSWKAEPLRFDRNPPYLLAFGQYEIAYSVEKMISRKLYSPWKINNINIQGNILYTRTTPAFELKSAQDPPMPFLYKVNISIPVPAPGVMEGLVQTRLLNHIPEYQHSSPFPYWQVKKIYMREFTTPFSFDRYGLNVIEFFSHVHYNGYCRRSIQDLLKVKGLPKVENCPIYHRIRSKIIQHFRHPVFIQPSVHKSKTISVFNRKTILQRRNFPRWRIPDDPGVPPKKELNEILPFIPDNWLGAVPREHYLQLPKPMISRRLKVLTKQLTENITSPYLKAMALRNWLRNNFRYQLYAKPLAKGYETADYFVFVLKEGHCEYFATALAVMARLVGLPSRVVTGFSPGDYNTMDNTFEVKESHAHAWTQIFIEGAGWLTFDATPPSAIQSQTKPVGLGKFRDPFGEEWRVMPPELSSALQERTAQQINKMREQQEENRFETVIDTLGSIKSELQKKIKDKTPLKSKSNVREKKPKKDLRSLLKTIPEYFQDFCFFLNGHRMILIPGFVLTAAIVLMSLILRAAYRQKRIINKVRSCFLNASSTDIPSIQAAKFCYYAVRGSLRLAGISRKPGTELMDFLESFRESEPVFYAEVKTVFEVFYKVEYGLIAPEQGQLSDILGHTANTIRLAFHRAHIPKKYYPRRTGS